MRCLFLLICGRRSLAAQGRAATAQIVRGTRNPVREKEDRAFLPVLKACIGDEIWWPRPSGLGGSGSTGAGDLASEVTHLPACLLGKQTRLRVFLSATGDARRMGRFHR